MTVIPQRLPSDPGPASRPTALDPAQLGFTPQRPVAWLNPVQLAATGIRVAFAAQFGAYLDKRELQVAFPTRVHDDHAASQELWLDYISDLGDGFDATYSMAYLLAQEGLDVNGTVLPRGEVLVLGGDQVYPTASGAAYEDRFEGPYRAAFPQQPAAEREAGPEPPTIYALPGNHDWYDGLTAFIRLFARRGGANIGNWQTKQTRSYFALRLPNRWWMLALDAQGDAYLDDPQLEYFKGVAATFQPGDRVILVTPQPCWVRAEINPRYYDTIDYFIRNVLDPSGATVALMLSGDLHHFARYGQVDGERQLITAGGGGAYTSATHHLPNEITVPPQHSQLRRASTGHTYQLKRTYPSAARSRWLGSGVFGRLPWRNTGFTVLLGVIHTMLLLALDNLSGRIITVPSFLMVAGILAGCIFFSVGLTEGQMRLRPFLLGTAHGCAHIALGVAGLFGWRALPFDRLPWPLPPLAAVVVYLPVAAVVAALLVSAHLLFAANFKVNVNELFAGQGIEDYKCFLRLRFAQDGTLTVYPIGVEKISKRWVPQPTGSWFRPATKMQTKLIDDPIIFAPAEPLVPAAQAA